MIDTQRFLKIRLGEDENDIRVLRRRLPDCDIYEYGRQESLGTVSWYSYKELVQGHTDYPGDFAWLLYGDNSKTWTPSKIEEVVENHQDDDQAE